MQIRNFTISRRKKNFSQLAVKDNLKLGQFTVKDTMSKRKIGLSSTKFFRVCQKENQLAGTLSGGEQQMLAMGRALMARPKLWYWWAPQWDCHLYL